MDKDYFNLARIDNGDNNIWAYYHYHTHDIGIIFDK